MPRLGERGRSATQNKDAFDTQPHTITRHKLAATTASADGGD